MSILSEVRLLISKFEGKEFFYDDLKCDYNKSQKSRCLSMLVENGEVKRIRINKSGNIVMYQATKFLKEADESGEYKTDKQLPGWKEQFPHYFTEPKGFNVKGKITIKQSI